MSIVGGRSFDPDKFRQLREERGLTQQELAETLCVESSTIANWEAGAHDPSEPSLISIASALNTSLDELTLGGDRA